jgi:hypothetical protein
LGSFNKTNAETADIPQVLFIVKAVKIPIKVLLGQGDYSSMAMLSNITATK